VTIAQTGAAPVVGYSSTCRVTVVTPQARVDVALPVQSTLAELIPQLIRISAAEGQSSAENPGWVLSRLGGAPLPVGLTVTAANISNGDVLYLNPRERHVAPLVFDDVVDAIANAAENRAGAWSPKAAYRVAMAAMAVVLLGATWLLVAGFWGTLYEPIACGVLAIATLLVGGALARAYGDAEAGTLCAGIGVPAAALAGMTALPPHLLGLGSAPLATALAAVALHGVLAVVILAHRLPWFYALITASVLGALTAAVVLLTEVTAVAAAAGASIVATALAATATMIALRLGRLPLPRVPADMDAFRADEKPTLGRTVLDQTELAEDILTGLLAALGVVILGCVAVLVLHGSTWEAALAGTLGLVSLLRSRAYRGTAQRVVLVGTGLAALACLGGWLAVHGPQTAVLGSAAVLLLSAVLCVIHANRAVRHLSSPYWERLLNLLEYLGLIALVPIFGVIAGLYVAIKSAI
jgi:type VII secretion integral membrane protein EccD